MRISPRHLQSTPRTMPLDSVHFLLCDAYNVLFHFKMLTPLMTQGRRKAVIKIASDVYGHFINMI